MLRLMIGQLRRQPVRSMTMLLGVLLATSGFTLLTGSVETSRLRVTGTVDDNYRSTYDVLVRPKGSRDAQELTHGQVRPNFLSGQFGGITLDQWRRILTLPGVEVAAPVAMVGYVDVTATAEIDLTEQLDRGARQQLLKVDRTWTSDRGLSAIDDPGDRYVYVTRNPVLWPRFTTSKANFVEFAGYRYEGRKVRVDDAVCDRPGMSSGYPAAEVLPDGRIRPICPTARKREPGRTYLTAADRSRVDVYQMLPDGGFRTRLGDAGGGIIPRQVRLPRLTLPVSWPVPLLLAAVDPVQEAELVGLDRAVVTGRYLRATDGPTPTKWALFADVPMLLSSTAHIDEQLTAGVSRLDRPPDIASLRGDELWKRLRAEPARRTSTVRVDAESVYRQVSERPITDPGDTWLNVDRVIQSGRPRYGGGEGALKPDPVTVDLDEVWRQENSLVDTSAPLFAHDRALRPLTKRELAGPGGVSIYAFPQVVGRFDAAGLTEYSALSAVPLETYQPASATGADQAARAALGSRPLLPNGNPGGYLATPPQLLTTLTALPMLIRGDDPAQEAPVSAIRVRVAGVAGLDDLSQERIRAVAEKIATTTGLEVDITIGSSPAPRPVELPAGSFGRPGLRLLENWTTKGVAVALTRAVDQKSALLFGLILVVCVLFLGNAVAASVRVRRRELAVLGCLGWPAGRLAALVLGEVVLVGLVAGILGAAVSLPLAAATGIEVSPGHALLAVPVACGIALLGGLVPALRAGRAHPMAAIRPPVVTRTRARRARTVYGMAVGNLVRVPTRSLVGVLALAAGVAAVSTLLVITWRFHGEAQGTLLGDAVSLQVRGVDLAAAVTTVALGVFAIADALYLSVRERSGELAALRACGWSDGELGRLIVTEGALLGLTGAVLGAGLGLGVLAAFLGGLSWATVSATLPVAAAGTAFAVLAAAVPAQLMRRLPLAAVLAED